MHILNKLKDIWKYSFLRDWYYNFKNRFFKKHYLIDTGLDKTKWWDTDYKMLYGMMSLLEDYVEKENALNIINWDSDDYHKKVKNEIIDILRWWKNYPNREKEINDQLSKWYELRFNNNDDNLLKINKRPMTTEEKKEYQHLEKLEIKLETEETEKLIQLVKIRKALWT